MKKLFKLPAFTLIEVVLYFSLLMIFILVVGRITGQVFQFANFSDDRINSSLEREMFFDIVSREVLSASCSREDWGDDEFIFKKKFIDKDGNATSCDIGFILKDKKIFRRSKLVCTRPVCAKRVCAKPVWSLLCRGVTSLKSKLSLTKKNRVVGVSVEVKFESNGSSKKYSRYFRLRNGEV